MREIRIESHSDDENDARLNGKNANGSSKTRSLQHRSEQGQRHHIWNTSDSFPSHLNSTASDSIPFFRRMQQVNQDEMLLHDPYATNDTQSDTIGRSSSQVLNHDSYSYPEMHNQDAHSNQTSASQKQHFKFPPRPPPFKSTVSSNQDAKKTLKYSDLVSKKADYTAAFAYPNPADIEHLVDENYIVRDEFCIKDGDGLSSVVTKSQHQDDSAATRRKKKRPDSVHSGTQSHSSDAEMADEIQNNWIRILLVQAKRKNSSKAALIDLEETLDRWFQHREPGSLDLIVLPEEYGWPEVKNWDTFEPIESVHWLKKLSTIVAKYRAYCVIGSFIELQQDLEQEDIYHTFHTTVLLNRKGNYVGMYRKRKTISSVAAGDRCAIFDTDFGRLALMLCFDVEDAQLLQENLAYKPDIIVNPAFIQSTTTIGEDHSNTWQTSMVVFSARMEKICCDYCTSILRCDGAWSSKYGRCASGTSQLVGPYRSLLSPNSSECCFYAEVPRKQRANYDRWLACTRLPYKERTETRMNTLNRYRVFNYKRHGNLLSESGGAAVTSIKKLGNHVITVSSDCSIIIHEYRTRQPVHHIRNAHEGSIFSMDIVGNTIWTCATDQCISEWSIDGKCLRIERMPSHAFITCIAAHPTDHNLMWLGDSSGRIRLYDKRSGPVENCQLITSSRDGSSPVIALRASKSSIYSVQQDSHHVKSWDTATGLSRPPTTFAASDVVTCISNIVSERIVIGTRDRLETWNTTRGDQLMKYTLPYGSRAEAIELLSDTHGVVSLIPSDPIRLENETIMSDRLLKHAQLNLFDYQKYRSDHFLHDFSENAQLFTAQSMTTEGHSKLLIGGVYGRVVGMEFESNMLEGNFYQIFK